MSDPIDVLLAETRARRKALHELIRQLRRDHTTWREAASQLPDRARLTVPQREMFRRCLRQRRHGA